MAHSLAHALGSDPYAVPIAFISLPPAATESAYCLATEIHKLGPRQASGVSHPSHTVETRRNGEKLGEEKGGGSVGGSPPPMKSVTRKETVIDQQPHWNTLPLYTCTLSLHLTIREIKFKHQTSRPELITPSFS